MEIKANCLELMVKEIEPTIQFYQIVLGFDLVEKEADETGKLYWALISLHDFKVSFKEEQRLKREYPFFQHKKVGGSVALVFEVKDLEGVHEKIKLKCETLNHPHLTPCGSKEFSMLDNNGYILTFERFSD